MASLRDGIPLEKNSLGHLVYGKSAFCEFTKMYLFHPLRKAKVREARETFDRRNFIDETGLRA